MAKRKQEYRDPDEIIVEDRYRKELGDLEPLKTSIRDVGEAIGGYRPHRPGVIQPRQAYGKTPADVKDPTP